MRTEFPWEKSRKNENIEIFGAKDQKVSFDRLITVQTFILTAKTKSTANSEKLIVELFWGLLEVIFLNLWIKLSASFNFEGPFLHVQYFL